MAEKPCWGPSEPFVRANICLKRLHVHLLRSSSSEWEEKEELAFWEERTVTHQLLHTSLSSLAFSGYFTFRDHRTYRRDHTHYQAAQRGQMALHQLLHRTSTCSPRCERTPFLELPRPPGSAPSSVTARWRRAARRRTGRWQSARRTPAETRWSAKSPPPPPQLP